MKKFLLGLLLAMPTCAPAGGLITDYIGLTPSSLPSVCNQGDIRYTIASGLESCGATNNWTVAGGGGGGTWGSITGTLSNQTDLNTALGLKVTNPMTTTGDLILGGASGAPNRLAIGSNTYVLTSNGTTASWAAASPGFLNPMTTLGDIMFENSTPAAARLAGSISATKNFLTQTGNGSISASPAWGVLASGDIPANAANTSGSAGSVSGTNTVTLANIVQAPAYTFLGNNTSSTANYGNYQSLILGTPGFADTGLAFQATGSVAGYYQGILQNTSNNASASTDFIVNNNLGTASTYYGDFGINSSTFTGSGSFNIPNATYLYSATGDLTLGTFTSNAIHFVINNGATDAMNINTSGVVGFPALATATIPYIDSANHLTSLPQGTSGQLLSSNGSGVPSWLSGVQSTTPPTVQKFLSTGTQTGQVFYVTSANATVGAVYSNNTYSFTVLQTISGGTVLYTSCSSSAAPTASGTLSRFSGSGDSTITFSSQQSLATYTTPTNPAPLFIKVTMVGGGGGGGGSGSAVSSGSTTGGTTYFGTSLLTSTGGGAGNNVPSAVSGGTNTINSPAIQIVNSPGGGNGGQSATVASVATANGGATGGVSPLGGAGGGGVYNGVGLDAAVNSGSGGGGGGATAVGASSVVSGSGGGAGGYIEAIINGPSASYYYSVGGGGTGGTATANGYNGGAGGSGQIIVEEYYGTFGPAVSAAPSYASAYMPNATSWSTTSASFVDPTISGSNTLTSRVASGITLTAAASNLPGITFTPPSANAIYFIQAIFGAEDLSASGSYRLTDGTIVLSTSSTASTSPSTMTLGGIYAPASTSATTVKLQLATSSGTAYIIPTGTLASSIEWAITRIDSLAVVGNGGIQRSVNNISTSQTAGSTALTDYVYNVTGTTTLTLPTAVGNSNSYTIKNTGVATVTIATTSAQTIDGSTTITMAVANTSLTVVSDGANWRIQ